MGMNSFPPPNYPQGGGPNQRLGGAMAGLGAQALQQPPAGNGPLQWNQPAPGQTVQNWNPQGSMNGAGAGAPDPQLWAAYRNLRPVTGKGKGPPGQAARAFASQYGTGYDPRGILARAAKVRGAG